MAGRKVRDGGGDGGEACGKMWAAAGGGTKEMIHTV